MARSGWNTMPLPEECLTTMAKKVHFPSPSMTGGGRGSGWLREREAETHTAASAFIWDGQPAVSTVKASSKTTGWLGLAGEEEGDAGGGMAGGGALAGLQKAAASAHKQQYRNRDLIRIISCREGISCLGRVHLATRQGFPHLHLRTQPPSAATVACAAASEFRSGVDGAGRTKPAVFGFSPAATAVISSLEELKSSI